MCFERSCLSGLLFITIILFASCESTGQKGANPKSQNLEVNPPKPHKDQYPYVQDVELPMLVTCSHDQLQAELDKMLLRNKSWSQLASGGNLSIGLVDLESFGDIRYAEVNGGEMMYAASLPKIAILLAAMDAIDKGELIETKELKNDMLLMINKSNNQASTRMIDRLGYAKIEAVLTDPRYNLYDEDNGGGLWVGKRYAAAGNRNPDPLEGLSHAATANQICRFYYMLMQGKLVNKKRSQEMMEYMVDPGLRHKFVNSLNRLAPRARLFRKSGSWSTFHSDSVMVWGPKRKYILAALVNDPGGEQILRKLVYEIDDVLKKSKM